MKKIIVLGCLCLFTMCLGQEEIEMDQYEIALPEESDEDEFELPPISINVSVANINEIHSNNKTNVSQEQAQTKELEKKKQENRQRLLKYARNAAVVAILLSTPYQDPATLSYVWKIIW